MTNGTTLRTWIVVAGGVPWLLLHGNWARAGLIAYSTTAVLFGILLVGEFQHAGSTPFLKSIILIVLLHLLVVVALVVIDLQIASINRLPRVVYGLLAFVVLFEWRVSLLIIRTVVGER
jgi:hypothetical protein